MRKFNHKKNQVLIQDMVKNVKISGVIMSCDKESTLPYYTINYDKSDDTTKVTSGKGISENFIYFNNQKEKPRNKNFLNLINLTTKLSKIFNHNKLDIEFAIDNKKKIHLLQVRPLIVKTKKQQPLNEIPESLDKLYKKIIKLRKRHHDLLGDDTAFGIMPDWNPAEMIGINPRPLAYSLYKELITDSVWAKNRKSLGFRDVTSNPLMKLFLGKPYIDLRVDFNSWVPSNLESKTGEKLVNYYMQKFKSNLSNHDKIEFNIVFTCYTFSTEKKLRSIPGKYFSKQEIKKLSKNLKKITQLSINSLNENLENIKILINKQKQVENSKMYSLDKIYWFVEDCKRYGTFSFAGLARSAFIAVDLLNSLVENKIISIEDKNLFLSSIKTITTDMNNDLKKLTVKDFKLKYGHLRPNSYDINSKNYNDAFKFYFSKKDIIFKKTKTYKFSKDKLNKIDEELKKNKLNISSNNLINFIIKSIKAREYAKYIFTKSIDLIFKQVKILTKRLSLSINDLSFVDIKTLMNFYSNLDNSNIQDILIPQINKNKKNFLFNQSIKLPSIITNPRDVYYFKEQDNESNFVTNQDIIAKNVFIKNFKQLDLKNKIVCIESADPGHDFLFSKGIKGLITKFGGANSHMAIRCNELNIPAAIGVGEKKFNEIKDLSVLRLNCENKKIEKI
jgi:phosphohistidine swiveling domain-containing protein